MSVSSVRLVVWPLLRALLLYSAMQLPAAIVGGIVGAWMYARMRREP